MDNQQPPLGRAGFLAIPMAIVLAVAFDTFWIAVASGAALGYMVANVKAVLDVNKLQRAIERNPFLALRAKIESIDTSAKIRFIFVQSTIGAIVFAAWTAAASCVALLLR